jgi:hypothetical protein
MTAWPEAPLQFAGARHSRHATLSGSPWTDTTCKMFGSVRSRSRNPTISSPSNAWAPAVTASKTSCNDARRTAARCTTITCSSICGHGPRGNTGPSGTATAVRVSASDWWAFRTFTRSAPRPGT